MTDDATWEHGWTGHELAQLRRLARLTLAEKVQWLEDAAHLVARVSQSAREATDDRAATDPAGFPGRDE